MPNKTRLPLIILVTGLALAAAVLFFLDWPKIVEVSKQASWRAMTLAIAFVVFSYLAQAGGFLAACRIFDIQIAAPVLLEIGFVSNILTNVLSTGGIPGQSYRALAMKRQNTPVSESTAVSIFHSYFNNLFFFALLPFAFWYLWAAVANHGFELAIAGLFFALALAISTVIVFSKTIRENLFKALARAGGKFFPKNKVKNFFSALDSGLREGIYRGRRHPGLLAAMLVLIAIDWAAMIVSLDFCFSAFGPFIGAGKLVAGFVFGISAGALSFVPGGIGVQDGSMAGIYVLLGAPFEQAVLALILFRILFYLIPFAASFFFYRATLGKSSRE